MFGFIFSLLIGALAGYIAGRIMGSETSTLRNIVLGILGGFVGSILFGLIGLSATGIVGEILVSVVGACVCIWVGRKLFKYFFTLCHGCSLSFSRRAVLFYQMHLSHHCRRKNPALTVFRKYDKIFLVIRPVCYCGSAGRAAHS